MVYTGLDYETGEFFDYSDMDISIEEVKERLNNLKCFIKEMMQEGIDFGNIPKTNKKCLFKAGAEKLCSAYGLSPTFELVSKTEDFEIGLFSFQVKVSLINKKTGKIEAEGAGCCNSFESKYKNQDKFNIANTILKMAKKRAFVDAVLLATRSSDIFTQDFEEEISGERREHEQKPEMSNNEKVSVEMASPKQITYIQTLLSQKRIPIKDAREHIRAIYSKGDSKELSKQEASEFIEYLRAC